MTGLAAKRKNAGRARQGKAGAGRDGAASPGRRAVLKKLAALGLLAAFDLSALSSCRRGAISRSAGEGKVILVGLDGLDPTLVSHYLDQGKLPHLNRLRDLGGFSPLATSMPPQSPVAWATLITGRDPGGHGIFDFIHRDPQTYLPYLSIARTDSPRRTLPVGDWKLPLSGATVQCLREGRAFWEVLTEQGIPCAIYRVPSNFPPRDNGAQQLAGLGVPDLRGSYGQFSYYTDDPPKGARSISGGAVYRVTVSNDHVRARLIGPDNALREGRPQSTADFDIWLDRAHKVGKIAVQGQELLLRQGEWSEWVPVRFTMLPHLMSVMGICRFYLKEVTPHFKLYVTPINVDPMNPALPISAPRSFGRDLAERFGRFYTMGFPEDVKALRHGVLDEEEYLHQSEIALGEARRMYESALNEFRWGLLFYYFSTTDRTQHMFWRAIDPKHPAYHPRVARKYGSVVEDCYRAADSLVGQALEACDRRTTLIVLSDHGFGPFYRTFNLNAWLTENGYLVGRESWTENPDILFNADWGGTTAYGIGFNGLYINLRGREVSGSVDPAERNDLLQQLSDELCRVSDPETGARVIMSVYSADRDYSNGLSDRAPDLILGYARGYRCSDDSVQGLVAPRMIEDNCDKWSGDHCIDRSLAPGVLFSNRAIRAQTPGLADIAASALAAFNIGAPGEMTGRPI